MNKIIKEKWLEALRSGEYNQTKGMLRDDKGYDCLGVLCNIHSEETGKGVWKRDGNLFYYISLPEMSGKCLNLGDDVISWSEVDTSEVKITISPEHLLKLSEKYYKIYGGNLSQDPTLTELNDSGIPFEEIANIIEQYL